MTLLAIIRGYPGSGKATLGKAIQEAGCGKFTDHNQVLTFITSIAGDNDGTYEDIAMLEQAIARKLLQQGQDVTVARGFSSANSVNQYAELAKSCGANFVIVRLDAPIETLAQRVQSAERHNDFNPTITPDDFYSWVTQNPIEPIPDEKIIDASMPINGCTRGLP